VGRAAIQETFTPDTRTRPGEIMAALTDNRSAEQAGA
jgi:hypothetical protein